MPNITNVSLGPNGLFMPAGGIEIASLDNDARSVFSPGPGELFAAASSVTALTKDVYVVKGANGTLLGFTAAITGTIATGADRTVTVDLQKSTGAGAFATVLSATIQFNNVSVLRTASSGTFSSTSLVAGDLLRVVVTVAGAAGNQALGLVCSIQLREETTG